MNRAGLSGLSGRNGARLLLVRFGCRRLTFRTSLRPLPLRKLPTLVFSTMLTCVVLKILSLVKKWSGNMEKKYFVEYRFVDIKTQQRSNSITAVIASSPKEAEQRLRNHVYENLLDRSILSIISVKQAPQRGY